jgi:ribosomal protein S18 acetylase RimI-like enzyme
VVPLMHESSRAMIDATFGAAAVTVLRCDFVRGKGIFGYRQQLVGVCVDGSVAATVTAYRGRRYRRLSGYTLLCAASRSGPVSAIRRMAAVSALFTPPSPDGLFLANLCVDGRYRGRGYGSALIGAACGQARTWRLDRVELDVSFGNAEAQRLYQRLGFTVTGETPAPAGSPLDGFRRMTLSL